MNEPNLLSFGIGFLAGYLDQAGRNFFAHTALAERAWASCSNRSTNSGTDEAGLYAGGKGTFRGLTRFVPLDGDISCAETVVFGAEQFF